jgi:peptidoglycan/xylan/chitin deacetylase (PgdA/CDA1 family)
VRFRPLILCFHAVSDSWPYLLAFSPGAFERQLKILLLRRYRPATACEVLGGSGRLLHVTFDDGFQSVANALPILERIHIPSTVFVCPGWVDRGLLGVPELETEARSYPLELATLDWDQLREIVDRGVEVGSHTLTHAHLCDLSGKELERELGESRDRLEAELERPCRFLAYPFGENDARVRAAAREAGYEAAFGLPAREEPYDRFSVPRVGLYRRDGLVRGTLKTSPVRRGVAALRRSSNRAGSQRV